MTTTQIRNGVDTGALFGALDAVKATPAAAKFQFRARNEWVSGTNSRSTIYDFFGLGEEQTHVESHTYDADHPRQLTGRDVGPSPVEFLLHALAACITAGLGNPPGAEFVLYPCGVAERARGTEYDRSPRNRADPGDLGSHR